MRAFSRPSGIAPVKNFSIRIFNEQTDLIAVRKVIHNTIEICYPAYYDENVLRYFKEIHFTNDSIRERANTGKTIVIQANNKIIGTGSLNNGTINSVFVEPVYQKQGVGKSIINALVKNMENNKVRSIAIKSPPGSTEFFIREGFNIVSEEKLVVDEFTHYHINQMEKNL